jgi:hypothetical protein
LHHPNNLLYTHSFQEPAAAHQSFSSQTVPTLSRGVPILEYLIEKWTNMANLPEFAATKAAIKAGIASLRKWYWRVDKCDAAYIALGELLMNLGSCFKH